MTALAEPIPSFERRTWGRKSRLDQSSAALTKFADTAYPSNPEVAGYRESAWVESTQRQLEEIQALQDGWDGYRAGPIRRDVIHFAEAVLNQIMKPLTPAPHIAPMAHSGLMIEWHTNGVDLEIEIEHPGRLWVSFEDSRTQQENECGLTTDLSKLQGWVDEISRRHPGGSRLIAMK
ncbi:MAG: hypothetical protein WAS73_18950 [Defluviicoccus sp.]